MTNLEKLEAYALLDYKEKQRSIRQAIDYSKELAIELNSTIKNFRNLKKTTLIANINNPESNTLGFKMSSVYTETLLPMLTDQGILKDKESSRLSSFINEISTLPIVDTFIKTNPIAQTVSSVVNIFGGLFAKKSGNEAEANDAMKTAISNFHNESAAYIKIYDGLSELNSTFSIQIEMLVSNVLKFEKSIEKLRKDLLAKFELIDNSDADNQFENLYPRNTEVGNALNNLSDGKFIPGSHISSQILKTIEDIKLFINESDIIVAAYFDSYIKFIEENEGNGRIPNAEAIKLQLKIDKEAKFSDNDISKSLKFNKAILNEFARVEIAEIKRAKAA